MKINVALLPSGTFFFLVSHLWMRNGPIEIGNATELHIINIEVDLVLTKITQEIRIQLFWKQKFQMH